MPDASELTEERVKYLWVSEINDRISKYEVLEACFVTWIAHKVHTEYLKVGEWEPENEATETC